MGEVGTVVSKNELKKPESQSGKDGDGKVEEEFTVARLYVSKMKSEVKNLVNKASMLESSQSEGIYDYFLIRSRSQTILTTRGYMKFQLYWINLIKLKLST